MTAHAWSILSLSLLTIMAAAAVAPALATIQAAFPQVSSTSIKMLLTAPSLCIIPMTFLSAKICNAIGVRRTIFLGGSLYLLGGSGGAFAPNFEVLMGTRIVLGIGVGILMPMANSLVSIFFSGEDRVRMMGRTASTANLGGIIALTGSGMLAQIGWQYSFAIYGIALITMTLVALFLKEPPLVGGLSAAKGRLPLAAKLGAASLALVMIVFYCIPTNLALFLVAEGFGDAGDAGLALALNTGTGFVVGLFLAKTRRLCGHLLGPAMLGSMALGFASLYHAGGLVPAMGGVVMVGIGFGTLWPSLLVFISQVTPLSQSMRGMALGGSMIFLGQFLSPLTFDAIGAVLGVLAPRTVFGLAGIATGSAALLLLLGQRRLAPYLSGPASSSESTASG